MDGPHLSQTPPHPSEPVRGQSKEIRTGVGDVSCLQPTAQVSRRWKPCFYAVVSCTLLCDQDYRRTNIPQGSGDGMFPEFNLLLPTLLAAATVWKPPGGKWLKISHLGSRLVVPRGHNKSQEALLPSTGFNSGRGNMVLELRTCCAVLAKTF